MVNEQLDEDRILTENLYLLSFSIAKDEPAARRIS